MAKESPSSMNPAPISAHFRDMVPRSASTAVANDADTTPNTSAAAFAALSSEVLIKILPHSRLRPEYSTPR